MDIGVDTTEPLLRKYRLRETLGHGSFGKVKIAEHVQTGHKVAIKVIDHQRLSLDMKEKVKREIKICRLFVHPHVIRLYEVIETPSDIYVIMEYASRGELFDYIAERGRLQEDEARHFFQQIISGLEYCHRNMVVHRDLKPENLLLDLRGNVKIADFGLSNIMIDGHFMKTSCGSPNYAAPEVVSGKLYAGPEVDIWSCGVILYALLCGVLPFDDESIPNLFKKIKSGRYTSPTHFSRGARDFISRMLEVDPMKRITIPEIHKHPWFKVHLPHYLVAAPPDAVEHLKMLNEDIIQEVVRMGYVRHQLIKSLQKRMQNDATVAYYLLLDQRSPTSIGYLGSEFHDSMEITASMAEFNNNPHSFTPPLSSNEQWVVGLQSPAHPRDIMTQILGVLRELNVRWKKIGHYNMKCLLNHHRTDNNGYINGGANIVQPQCAPVKFEIQLYKKGDDGYLLDLQRLTGPVFLFLNFCAFFMRRLNVC